MNIEDIKTTLAAATPEQLSELRNLKKLAKHLEAVWIEREQTQRVFAEDAAKCNELPDFRRFSAAAEAVKQCRLDLQHEFSLTLKLGPGPMTHAEEDEYKDSMEP